MNTKDVVAKFKITRCQVYKMAKELNIPKDKRNQYIFPDSFRPIYIPDKRVYKKLFESSLFPYVYLMDTISKMWYVKDNYMGIDDSIRITIVRELKNNNLIILKENASQDSLDYRDYLVSLVSGDWFSKQIKDKKEILLTLSKGVAYGVTAAVLDKKMS